MARKLTREERLRRKTPELQALIIAIEAAIAHVRSDYEREQELPGQLELLMGPEKGTSGTTVDETLRKCYYIFFRHREDAHEVARAADLLSTHFRAES